MSWGPCRYNFMTEMISDKQKFSMSFLKIYPLLVLRRLLLIAVLGGANFGTPFVFADGIRDAVVKVFVTKNSMDYYQPWQSEGSNAMSGSGAIISGNRILTNAHVVSDHTFIQVRKETNPKRYTAKVQAIGYDCDLAILSVDDPTFFEGITPLEFGELPNLRDKVIVIGFPLGGDKLSITEGVVSRIEVVSYSQSAKEMLGVQIDAAINPGNSGGPVLKDGKLVGVAMQVIKSSQNIGYMIPTSVIEHFLTDLGDGKYDGFPQLGIEFVNTENKALRKYYGVDHVDGGVLIYRVLPFSAVDHVLREGDVLLQVENISVGVDGTYNFREGERLSIAHLINQKQIGDQLRLQISRKGKLMDKMIKFNRFTGLVAYPHNVDDPTYYIYGGLIFSVLSSDLLQSWGNSWWEKAPLDFLYYLIGSGRLNLDRKKEVVVLLDVLPDDSNVGYHDYNSEVIKKLNGKEVNSFKEFVLAIEKDQGHDYSVFETEHRAPIILPTAGIDEANKNIMERNHIPFQYSKDVAQWLGKKREQMKE